MRWPRRERCETCNRRIKRGQSCDVCVRLEGVRRLAASVGPIPRLLGLTDQVEPPSEQR